MRLANVRYIADLIKNLISTSQLDDEGYVSIFGNSQWKITKGSMVVVKEKRTGTLYFLADSGSSVSMTVGDMNTVTSLWHRRLGHLSEKNLSILHR